MTHLRLWGLALLVSACVWATSAPVAHARGYENVPLGDRTASMGGTGQAKGSDSAMPSLNPAGISRVAHSTLSLSASAYQLELLIVPEFARAFDTNRYGRITPEETELSTTSFLTIASAFAAFLHLGEPGEDDWVLAFALTVPFARQGEIIEDIGFTSDQSRSANFRWSKEALNTSSENQFAIHIGAANTFGRLRLGASFQFFITSLSLAYEREENIEDGIEFERRIISFERQATSVDGALMLGAQFELTDRLSLGASVRGPSLHLTGDYTDLKEELSVNNFDDATNPTSLQTNVKGNFINGIPVRLGLGFEYGDERWGFGADLSAFIPFGDARRFEGDGSQHTRIAKANAREQFITGLEEVHERKPVVNASVGGYVSAGQDKWIRFGAFTDFSSVESDFARNDGVSIFEQNLDFFGVTGGYTTRLGPVETTLGIKLAVGFGTSGREFLAPDLSTLFEGTDAEAYSLSFFLSGAIDTTLEDNFAERTKEGEGDAKPDDNVKPDDKGDKGDKPPVITDDKKDDKKDDTKDDKVIPPKKDDTKKPQRPPEDDEEPGEQDDR